MTDDFDIGLFPPRPELIVARAEETGASAQPIDERVLEPKTYGELLESICGTSDDSQDVEQYDGTLGVTVAFVNARQRPVGQVQWNDNLASIYTNPGDVSGVRWGSGTLISNDLFLTAGHLFDQTADGWTLPRQNGTNQVISSAEIATNMRVNFDFQFDPMGNLRTEQSFAITNLVEFRLGGLDFAVVELAGNPGATFGRTRISDSDAAVGDMLCIIGHPAGLPKRIEAGPATELTGDRIRYNDIDTLGGNSGSGILRDDEFLVGVHTNGGCTAAGGSNFGVRISSILAASPTVRGLVGPFDRFILQTGTALHETDESFAFAMTDWDGDGRPDLVAIKKSATGTNSTEVHILSGASDFQQFILQTGTALHETDESFAFAMTDWDGDGRPDLVAIKKSATGTNSTEVHVLG
jgi:V8-like Glu-specific endopeptidase